MNKTQVKVSDNLKGEILIKAMNKTYKAGTILNMNDDQFWSEHTQWAIENGFLVAMENYAPQKVKGIRVRSVHARQLALNVLKRSVHPNETIFLTEEQFDDDQVQKAMEAGFLVKADEKPVKAIKDGIARKSIQPVEKPTSNKKSIKRIISDAVAEKEPQAAKSSSDRKNTKSVLKKLATKETKVELKGSAKLAPTKIKNDPKPYIHQPEGTASNLPKIVTPNIKPGRKVPKPSGANVVRGNNTEVE